MLRAAIANIKWPKVMLVFFWHMTTIIIEFSAYSTFFRFRRGTTWTTDAIDSYLAFVIITLVAYAFIAGPLLIMAYKYSATERQRTFRLKSAITVMYLLSTTPLFFIELLMVKKAGILGVIQGIAFVLQIAAWLASSWIVWFFYMMEVSRFVHEKRGYGRDVAFKRARMLNAIAGMPGTWKGATLPVPNPASNQPWVV